MPFRRIGLALFILAITALTQCTSRPNALVQYLNTNYKNKLDVRALIGTNRQIIGFDIKNSKALLTLTTDPEEHPSDSIFHVIIDIPQNKIVKYDP